MTTINKIIPLNRVEGDLEIHLELDRDNVVTAAKSVGTMYRGIENLMTGRGPLDSLVITPRICGICTTAHLNAAAKALDEDALRLAVAAHVRHVETNYDELLLKGIERWVAREKLYPEVTRILDRWKSGGLQDYCQRPADESIPAEGKYTRQTPTSR